MTTDNPHDATTLDKQLRQHMQAERYREAAACCDELNQRFPDYLPGWAAAVELGLRIGEPAVALQAVDRALLLAPGNHDLLLQKINCAIAAGEDVVAATVADELADVEFGLPQQASAMGLLLSRLGQNERAVTHYRRAVELQPDNASHHYNLAAVERYCGRLEDAAASLQRAIELNPDDADAYLLRSGLRTQTADSNNIDSLQDAIRSATSNRSRLRLNFALAKELEDIGDYPQSFQALQRATSLRRSVMKYTPQRDLQTLRRIRECYTAELVNEVGIGHVNAEPIFIIGMPRTGTTLVDRILGSHPAVKSAGELQNFATVLMDLSRQQSEKLPQPAHDAVQLSTLIDFEELGRKYVESTRPATGTTPHFTDKLPLNFLYAGLIKRALPKARIVLLERDPMDTIYAVYKTLFEGVYPFSYDLEELTEYYIEYHALVSHWQSVMPGAIHTVQYESLVADPEPVLRDLLEYCGLSWDARCLDFHKDTSATTTASAVQVREDVLTRSIGNWRNYESQLQSVLARLQEAGIAPHDRGAVAPEG
jgi:tetratricopeptide (TPR) repeat protein